MRPMAAAAIGALISGIAAYAVGARAAQDSVAEIPTLVQTLDGRYVLVSDAKPVAFAPAAYATAPQPVAAPLVVRQSPVPARVYRTAERTVEPVQEREVVQETAARSERSWTKTAMILGGSAASGAGVGGLVGGKKGALVGAAIGGGAASIYEATRRR